ncbi:hypothetical protein C798_27190 [Herbaspirillum rubrisubalbicans Os34]|uniref:Uncharacterized protein n=1 Tax=Herbaspirillum rubrisubalbicans Os34 TaxID=1235827 RepID=A0A6M3ZYM2_9BURK|nr:hypothetical protein C798_27190 [Herbaspirillum rubrisubalbicans Os34]
MKMPSDGVKSLLSPKSIRFQRLREKTLNKISGRAKIEADEFDTWHQQALSLAKFDGYTVCMSMRAMPWMLTQRQQEVLIDRQSCLHE